MRKLLIVLPLIALSPAPARAWHAPAHMTAAAVAYRQLHPDTRKELALVLRKHPDFAKKWKPGVAASGVPADLYLFMQAAVWPDVARGDARYDHPEWHTIERVYSPDGTDYRPMRRETVLSALDLNKRRFAAPATRPADRAIALCWILHLIGDLHGPFNATTRVTAETPTGDRGGTEAWVLTAEGPRHLRQLWGELLNEARTPAAADALAARLMTERPLMSLPERDTRTADGWVEESLRLAVAAGYHHWPHPERPYDRVPLDVGRSREAARPLPEGYLANARSNAERRVTLAGYRIAGVLAGFLYGLSSAPARG